MPGVRHRSPVKKPESVDVPSAKIKTKLTPSKGTGSKFTGAAAVMKGETPRAAVSPTSPAKPLAKTEPSKVAAHPKPAKKKAAPKKTEKPTVPAQPEPFSQSSDAQAPTLGPSRIGALISGLGAGAVVAGGGLVKAVRAGARESLAGAKVVGRATQSAATVVGNAVLSRAEHARVAAAKRAVVRASTRQAAVDEKAAIAQADAKAKAKAAAEAAKVAREEEKARAKADAKAAALVATKTDTLTEVEAAPKRKPKPEPKRKPKPEPKRKPKPEPKRKPKREPAVEAPSVPKVFPSLPRITVPRPSLPSLPKVAVPRPTRQQLAIGSIAVAVALLAYVGAQASVANTVAPNTVILGNEIGGLSTDAAVAELSLRFTDFESRPVRLEAHGWFAYLEPADAGLSLDVQATVGDLTGFTWKPGRLWSFVVGGGEVSPALVVDGAALASSVMDAVEQLEQTPASATVEFRNGNAFPVPARDGVAINAKLAIEAVADRWLAGQPIVLAAVVRPPGILTPEAERAATAFNQVTLASPVALEGPNGSAEISATDVAEFGVVVAAGDRLVLMMDGEQLANALLERNPGLNSGARNARQYFDGNHMLVLDESVPARVLDVASLGDAAVLALNSVSRVGEMPFLETPADVTTVDLAEGDFTARVSSFSTPFTPRGWAREQNIANAGRIISGMVIQPGETFSLIKALTPIDASNGFRSAGVIIGGEHVDAPGGGLSQMATTLYNTAYWAGLEDVAHRSHTEWFTRYPAGREATIFTPSLDMKFRNDTPHAIVINSYVDGARIYVDFWSTPYYRVEGTTTITSGRAIQGCGFGVLDNRKVYVGDDLVKNESQRWSYRRTDYC